MMTENRKNFETVSASTNTYLNTNRILKRRTRFMNNVLNTKLSPFQDFVSKFNKFDKISLHKDSFLSPSSVKFKKQILLLDKNKATKLNSINNKHQIKRRNSINDKPLLLYKSKSNFNNKKISDSIQNFILAPNSFRKSKNLQYNSTEFSCSNKTSRRNNYFPKKQNSVIQNLKSNSYNIFKTEANIYKTKNGKNNENSLDDEIYEKTVELVNNPNSVFYLIHKSFLEEKYYRNSNSRINIRKKFKDYKKDMCKMEQKAFLEVFNLKKLRLIGNEVKFKNVGIAKK